MLIRRIITAAILFFPVITTAQQFIGLNPRDYASIQQVPYNPAWVNMAATGTEINIFGVSAMGGTNAYMVTKDYLFSGLENGGREGRDYFKDPRVKNKHVWGNIDVLGPAASVTVKSIHNVGIYTRMRQINRAGNMKKLAFELMGDMRPEYYLYDLSFAGTGGLTHTFAEVGISYGRELRNDYYHILRGGVTVKYLMGWAAGSIYNDGVEYNQQDADTIFQVSGRTTGLFTYNVNPYDPTGNYTDLDPNMIFKGLSERAGKGALGLDLGIQYEYHPTGNPNETTPYLYSLALSITDIGSIAYYSDTASGTYDFQVNKDNIAGFNKTADESYPAYLDRLLKDSLVTRTEAPEKFRTGLPTALRFNGDYYVTPRFNIAVNFMINLRSSHKQKYNPGYVSYFNFTPTYGSRKWKVSMPFSFVGYQTVTLGAIVQAGPFYLGSNTLFSTLLSSNIRNADAFMGFMLKLRKEPRNYYTY